MTVLNAQGKELHGRALKEYNRVEAIERLRDLFAGDDKPVIHTITRHVSASGMTRDISLIYVKEGAIHNITYWGALALEWQLSEKSGNRAIRVSGAGMDMGFHTVYTLSRLIYRDTATEIEPGYVLSQAWL
jgi:hypothetical protein